MKFKMLKKLFKCVLPLQRAGHSNYIVKANEKTQMFTSAVLRHSPVLSFHILRIRTNFFNLKKRRRKKKHQLFKINTRMYIFLKMAFQKDGYFCTLWVIMFSINQTLKLKINRHFNFNGTHFKIQHLCVCCELLIVSSENRYKLSGYPKLLLCAWVSVDDSQLALE